MPELVASASVPARARPEHRHSLVAIGASTGGPGAIVEILRGLPPQFRLPILVVLHINEPFGTAFADWLDGQTTRRVENARAIQWQGGARFALRVSHADHWACRNCRSVG